MYALNRWLLIGFVSLTGPACGFGATQTITYEDEGRICINAQPHMREVGTVLAGEVATVFVHMHGCLSSSCDRLLYAECRVELNDGVLRVFSTGAVEDLRGRNVVACTDDCGFMVAQCSTPELAEGEYILVHGEVERTLTVPSTQVACPL
jgi:hypothetical protein